MSLTHPPTGRTSTDWNGHRWIETPAGWRRADGVEPPSSVVTTTHRDGTVTVRRLCMEQINAERDAEAADEARAIIRRFLAALASDDPDAVKRVFESVRHEHGSVCAMNCRHTAERMHARATATEHAR
jgi:hypothetical protein